MKEGLVSFEKVQDWGRLVCQRHICEIQGALGAIAHPPYSLVIGRGRHICEIQGTSCLISQPRPAEATRCMDTARVACLQVSGAGVS